jgi:hypothetical protein
VVATEPHNPELFLAPPQLRKPLARRTADKAIKAGQPVGLLWRRMSCREPSGCPGVARRGVVTLRVVQLKVLNANCFASLPNTPRQRSSFEATRKPPQQQNSSATECWERWLECLPRATQPGPNRFIALDSALSADDLFQKGCGARNEGRDPPPFRHGPSRTLSGTPEWACLEAPSVESKLRVS